MNPALTTHILLVRVLLDANLGGVGTLINTLTDWLNALNIALGAVAVAIIGVKLMFGGGIAGDDRSLNSAFSSAKFILLALALGLVGNTLLTMAKNTISTSIGGGGGPPPTPTGLLIPHIIATAAHHLTQQAATIFS